MLSPLEVLRIAGKAGAEVVARLVTEPVAGPAGDSALRFLPDAVYRPGERTSN